MLLMLAWILLPACPVLAQLRFAGFSTDLNGILSPGYTADYGNQTSSDHSWTIGGAANFSGSYYNPNFLSFNASFYLNQSRANSNYQSISDASGINVTTNIFGGSRFPGSISFSKSYNSEGDYDVPGVANFVTHGNSDTFAINWSENLPNAPSLSVGFQLGSSKYSVYGSDDDGTNSFHSLNLHSSYTLAGFNMGGFFTDGGGSSAIPEVVTGSSGSTTHSSNNDLGFNVTHLLPLRGSFSASVNRSDFSSDYMGSSTSGTIDTFNSSAAIHPTSRISLTANANYSDNLSGQLVQSVVAAGGVVSGVNSNDSSNSLDLMAVAGYGIASNLQASIYAERRTQYFLGESYAVQSYGASATYGRKVLDGNLNAALSVTDNSSNTSSANALGFASNVNYSSQLLGWNVTGSFGYSQNVQTLLVTEMNSFYNYAGNLRRRWGKLNVSAGAGASRTGLTDEAGAANSSESYNTSVGYGSWLTATSAYSTSSGQALATGTGLVPVTGPIPSSSLVSLYGGNSFSFGLSSTPVKKLTLTASYSSSNSNTTSNSIASTNRNDQYNALIQYQVRKMSCTSGYSRLAQGFSSSGTPTQVVSSFYIGVSRWFNIF